MDFSNLPGLTSSEVDQRLRDGQVNRTPHSDLRNFAQILARNLFTWFNAMVVPAAVALFVLKEYQGAIAVSGMAIVNSFIGLTQEIRAKIHLDKLAILVETRARVLREGLVRTIPAGEVVLGETVLIETGENVVADGPLLAANFLEIDEALLTGESDPVRRNQGDRLLSGSFCVAGEGAYRADKVGGSAFAHQTSAQARRYHFVASPMTRIINRLVQILSYVALLMIAIYTIAYFAKPRGEYSNPAGYVEMIAATITSLVPQGMVLTATISFTLGAVVMSRRGAIVQRLNAVEAMASINVICTDKTGTLTTNHLRLEKLHIIDTGLGEDAIRNRLWLFASASVDRQNKNIQALCSALKPRGEVLRTPLVRTDLDFELLDQIPFKSQHRYSAVRLRENGTERVLVLGAFEALDSLTKSRPDAKKNGLCDSVALRETVENLQRSGLRVLMFAEIDPLDLPAFPQPPSLPTVAMRSLALVCLGDELRAEAGGVLESLSAQGVAFKIISGDNPDTVQATVRHLDLPLAHEPVVSGDELAKSANPDELIRGRSVFGRVSPEQKVAIVESLKRQGFRVAMIGDGVNDVLPIKRADLGIAMGEGSQASKTVAGLILENNNFALLPETLEEGRTIVRNLRRSSKLFLVKNVYSLILIVAFSIGILHIPFPYLPQQVTLLNWLVIGIPAFVIALSRQRTQTADRPRFLYEVGSFALRTGILFALAGIVTLVLSADPTDDHKYPRTMLLSVLILLGITALFRSLRDGEKRPLGQDGHLRLLALLAIPTYLLAMYWPFAADFFRLVPLGLLDWLVILAVVSATTLLSIVSDKSPSLLRKILR